jgi:hypothetical protein
MIDSVTILALLASLGLFAFAYALYRVLLWLYTLIWDTIASKRDRRKAEMQAWHEQQRAALLTRQEEQALLNEQAAAVREWEFILLAQGEPSAEEDV